MPLFSAADLAVLAKETAIVKQKDIDRRLKSASLQLFERIMKESQEKGPKMMQHFVEDIRIGRKPQSILWSCKATKFNPSLVHPGRDCRDEEIMHPENGKSTTHLEYALETGRHEQVNPFHNTFGIWTVLKFSNIISAIAAELGPNFICEHRYDLLEEYRSGICYRQSIMVMYLPKGRTADQEAIVQKAYADFPIGHCDHCGCCYSRSSVIRCDVNEDNQAFCQKDCAQAELEMKWEYELDQEEIADHRGDYDY